MEKLLTALNEWNMMNGNVYDIGVRKEISKSFTIKRNEKVYLNIEYHSKQYTVLNIDSGYDQAEEEEDYSKVVKGLLKHLIEVFEQKLWFTDKYWGNFRLKEHMEGLCYKKITGLSNIILKGVSGFYFSREFGMNCWVPDTEVKMLKKISSEINKIAKTPKKYIKAFHQKNEVGKRDIYMDVTMLNSLIELEMFVDENMKGMNIKFFKKPSPLGFGLKRTEMKSLIIGFDNLTDDINKEVELLEKEQQLSVLMNFDSDDTALLISSRILNFIRNSAKNENVTGKLGYLQIKEFFKDYLMIQACRKVAKELNVDVALKLSEVQMKLKYLKSIEACILQIGEYKCIFYSPIVNGRYKEIYDVFSYETEEQLSEFMNKVLNERKKLDEEFELYVI